MLAALHAAWSDDPSAWLDAEKARRGCERDTLVFVGMHNIAQLFWCPMFARLKSEANEDEMFGAYLTDRVRWAVAADMVHHIPASREDWLATGDSLTLEVVERLQACDPSASPSAAEDKYRTWACSLSREATARIVSMGGNFDAGELYEARYAEQHPTLRWNFEWGRRVLVGVPDGLRKHLVYDFKTAKKRFFMEETRSIAFAQADLYGLFFRRTTKRVQIAVRDDDTTETWEEPVDSESAERTLARFDAVVAGARVEPPHPGKCKRCEFRGECSVAPNFAATTDGRAVLRTELIRRRLGAAEARRDREVQGRALAAERLASEAERLENGGTSDDETPDLADIVGADHCDMAPGRRRPVS